MIKGRPIYYGEPDDGVEGYFILARAIIRRALRDAQIDLSRCESDLHRRRQELIKMSAQQWIEDVLSEADTRQG